MTEPFADLIEKFPKLFGIFGSRRKDIERKADEQGGDRDYTPGIDDGEGPWNQPNQE